MSSSRYLVFIFVSFYSGMCILEKKKKSYKLVSIFPNLYWVSQIFRVQLKGKKYFKYFRKKGTFLYIRSIFLALLLHKQLTMYITTSLKY